MTQENVNQNEKRTTQNGRRTTTKSNYKTEKRKTEEAYGKTTKMEEKGARNKMVIHIDCIDNIFNVIVVFICFKVHLNTWIITIRNKH